MHGDTRPLRLGMHTYTLHFFGFGILATYCHHGGYHHQENALFLHDY